MKLGALVVLALTLSACEGEQVRQCQEELITTLKAPSSYKRVNLEQSAIPDSIHKPPYDSVTITYDAVNSLNAPLRDKYNCFFKPRTTDRIDPFKIEVDQMERNATSAVDNALGAATNTGAAENRVIPRTQSEDEAGDSNDPYVSCIDRADSTNEYASCGNGSVPGGE